MRLALLAALALCACKDPPETRMAGVAKSLQPTTTHGKGRERWRGGGVYLDGVPIGMLRHGELPAGLEPIWETQRRRLPFRAGEPIRYAETRVPRYRIVDYLRAVGVELDTIVEVHLHGGRDSAIVLTRDDLRRRPGDFLFKFAGDTFGKPIPIVRGLRTSFDDLQAMTIYSKRKPPRLTAKQTLELDGMPVHGIPYFGEPLRQGVRVYVDDRLVTVLKRNQLGGSTRLADLLSRVGVATEALARVDLVYEEARAATMSWRDVDIAFGEGASGEVMVAGLPAHAIALYTR